MGLRTFRRLFLIATLGLAGLNSCTRDACPLDARLQAAVDKCHRRYDVKGASVAVILPDETLWRGEATFPTARWCSTRSG